MQQSLTTPLEPSAPHASQQRVAAAESAQQSVQRTLFRCIEAAVASSRGSQHERNEDAHSALDSATNVFVVADGVGGGAMARMASQMLVSKLHAALQACALDGDRVRRAVADADRAIARRIAQLTDAPGAATVALCSPVDRRASKWLVAWVGDCRVYRVAMRGRPAIELLSRDDSFRLLGEQPPAGGAADDPARMVGNGAVACANVALHDLARGDALLLCSDGVHRFLDDDDWCRLLSGPLPLARACEGLIAQARANGSVDDATVLVVRRAAFGLSRPRWAWWGVANAEAKR